MSTQYNSQDPSSIKEMFNSVAERYDKANALLSFNLHKVWNKRLIKSTIKPKESTTLLDICSGTGDIAFAFLMQRSTAQKAILVDFSKEMLQHAKLKAKQYPFKKHEISYIEGDAQQLPVPDSSVDAVTIAYGIRNVRDNKLCLQEIYRTLKPEGRVGILELTRPTNPFLKLGHQIYLKTALPLIGRFVTPNKEAYNYLSESIYQFLSPQEIKKTMATIGFQKLKITPLFGGIATIITGEKSS